MKDYVIDNHDMIFMFGDTNFRIDLDNQICRQLIEQKRLTDLQRYDQLLVIKHAHPILSKFSEGPLNFDPTFKYDDNCDIYDTSKKNRVPAWFSIVHLKFKV